DYLRNLGEEGIRHARNKPFSDAACAEFLLQFGGVLALLPPPPARVLDAGCGTGWTSRFLARRGYDGVGLDISPDMVLQADQARAEEGLDNVRFVVGDYEAVPFAGEFDAALFYDALHHAEDEDAAVRMVHRALRPGGVCVASEPGHGHASSQVARQAVEQHGV